MAFTNDEQNPFIFYNLNIYGEYPDWVVQIPSLIMSWQVFLRGSNSVLFILASLFCFPSQLRSTLGTPGSKFFPLRGDPFWKDFVTKGSKEKSQKVFCLIKMTEKLYVHTLNVLC